MLTWQLLAPRHSPRSCFTRFMSPVLIRICTRTSLLPVTAPPLSTTLSLAMLPLFCSRTLPNTVLLTLTVSSNHKFIRAEGGIHG